LKPVLEDTLGVILYQEQIIEIATNVAGMPPSGADRFRRAMTRHLPESELAALEADFVAGCRRNGVPVEIANQVFASVRGFAVYGFCRSHAAAFARTSYETAWLKLNFPAHFYCGLLNNQPMGFYHPSVLVEDAKRHGVDVMPVDVNASAERCLPLDTGCFRVGLNYLRELGEAGAKAIVSERSAAGEYRSFDNFLERLRGASVNPRAVRNLVMVGAFDALGSARRELLWSWQERWRGKGLHRKLGLQSELRLPAQSPSLADVD